MSKQKIRCAVYTRKSHEEGLDQEFNSIDAQRESGISFIESQRHEGWEVIQDHYDDPAYSGGNIDRPALQRLLRDVENDRVDCIVVYPGAHSSIIDRKLWNQVHGILKDNSRYRADQKRMNSAALLRGVIFTKDGHSMYPTFCCKHGKRYSYYVTAKAAKTSYAECPIKQIPAGEIEEIAINQIHGNRSLPRQISPGLVPSVYKCEGGMKNELPLSQDA